MELVMEFLLELILEGSVEVIGARKVPVLIRVIAGIILLVVYGGLFIVGVYA